MVTIRPDGFTPETLKLDVKMEIGGFVSTISKTLKAETPENFVSTTFLPDERTTSKLPETAPRPKNPIEIAFESEITDLDYGANGRFVVAFLASESTCHIIDCLTGKTLHKIPTPADSIIAAGLTSLFTSNSAGISKWDLESGKNIFRDQTWFDGLVQDLSVGSGSDRFLAVAYRAFDRKDMTRVELRSQKDGRLLAIEPTELKSQAASLLSISERGTSIGLSSPPPSQTTQGLLQLQGGRYELLTPASIGWIKPGPLDQTIVSGTGQIGIIPHGFGGKRTHNSTRGLIPTSHQGVALSVPIFPNRSRTKTKPTGNFGLVDTMTGRPLAEKIVTLDGLLVDPSAVTNHSSNEKQLPPRLPWDERFFYSVDYGHLIAIPSDSRSILIQPLDLKTILNQQKSPYLLTDSDAPIQLEGESFEAQLKVLSSAEKPSFELIAAPPGFTVSETGLIAGKITPAAKNQPQQLIVLVKANKLERFWKHTFVPK